MTFGQRIEGQVNLERSRPRMVLCERTSRPRIADGIPTANRNQEVLSRYAVELGRNHEPEKAGTLLRSFGDQRRRL